MICTCGNKIDIEKLIENKDFEDMCDDSIIIYCSKCDKPLIIQYPIKEQMKEEFDLKMREFNSISFD